MASSKKTAPPSGLETDPGSIIKAAKKRGILPEKERKQRRENAIALRESVADVTPEKVATGIAKAQVGVGEFLASIQDEMGRAQRDLTTIRAATELEREELSRLHDIDVVASDIDQLVADHDAKKVTLKADMAELQGRASEARKGWEAEQATFESQRATNRERERTDYEYKLKVERRRLTDEWDQQLADKKRENSIAEQDAQRAWDLKLEEIEAREVKVASAEELHGSWDEALKEAADKKAAIETGAIKKELQHQRAMSLASEQSKNALLRARVDRAGSQIAALTEQNAALQSKLDSAQERVAEISIKGLEASGRVTALGSLQTALSNSGQPSKKS